MFISNSHNMSLLRSVAFCSPYPRLQITVQERAYRTSIKPLSRAHKAFPALWKRLFLNTESHIYLHDMCNTLVCSILCLHVKRARIRGKNDGCLRPHDSQRLDIIRILLSVIPYYAGTRCFSCTVLTIIFCTYSPRQPHPAARHADGTTNILSRIGQ